MKFSTLDQLSNHLREKDSPLVQVVGADPFDRRKAVEQIATLKGISPETVTTEQLPQELESRSLLASSRLLLHEGKLPAKLKKRLESFAGAPQDGVTLVLSHEETNGSLGVVLEFAKPPPWRVAEELALWLQAEAESEGKSVDPDAAHQLVQQVGNEKSLLSSELEKLICYVGDGHRISRSMVQEIGSVSRSESVWQLSDALLGGRKADLFRLWRSLATREGVHAVIGQLRALFQQGRELCRGADPSTVVPFLRGKRLEQRMRHCQGYGAARFERGLIRIQATDLRLKTDPVDPALLIEMLLMELAR